MNPTNEILNVDLPFQKPISHSLSLHPWNVTKAAFDTLKMQLNQSLSTHTVAIGEVGLDRNSKVPFDLQLEIFEMLIALSEEFKLPLIIHCVKAFETLIELKLKHKPSQKWIVHGFNKYKVLDQLLNHDILISLGASLLNNEKLQSVIRDIPLNSCFLETDDYSIPIEKMYLKLAEIKEIEISQVVLSIEKNIKNTFVRWKIG